MQSITGKSALITGGTKGIGYGIAAAMVQAGMQVVITGRSLETVAQAVAELKKIGIGSVHGVVSDVRDYASQQQAVTAAIEHFGKLDVLVANAGLGHFAPIDNLSIYQWKETIDVNLTGAFYSIKSALDELKKSQGYIITMASLAGTNFFANGAAYNASKFGLVGFTQAVMLDVRKYGIKTTTIMPGSVATWFNDHTPSEKDYWKIQIEDLGELVVDLLRLHPRTLPSKVEVRPTMPPGIS